MTSSSLRRGWCPDLFAPMEAKDGWIVRLRPPLGRLSADQIAMIAQAATCHGNGVIELTNRGNVQLRGFARTAVDSFAATAIGAGLSARSAAEDHRRAVLVSPLAGLDPACAPQTFPIARTLSARLAAAEDIVGLSAKFGFFVDGGGYFPLGGLPGDLGLLAAEGGWALRAGGWQSEALSSEQAISALLGAARRLSEAGVEARPSRDTQVARDVLINSGLSARHCREPNAFSPVGSLPGNVNGIAPAFGRTDAAHFASLCACADAADDGCVRVTPWRSIVIAGAPPDGFITDPADPLLSVRACIGTVGCVRAEADVDAVARMLATEWSGGVLHVSGCAKGCAHPRTAALTLVAHGGQYDVIDGPPGGAASLSMQTLEQVRALLATRGAGETQE